MKKPTILTLMLGCCTWIVWLLALLAIILPFLSRQNSWLAALTEFVLVVATCYTLATWALRAWISASTPNKEDSQ